MTMPLIFQLELFEIFECRERETIQLMNQIIPFFFFHTPIHIVAEYT